MKRVLITTGKAHSLKEVSRKIAYKLEKEGFITSLQTNFSPWFFTREGYNGLIFFYPADPIYASEYVSYYTLLKPRLGERIVFYTTVEGRPVPQLASRPIFKHVEWVPNSKFTKKMLETVGWRTTQVVYHGVDPMEPERVKIIAKRMRKEIEQTYGGKVIIGLVSAWNVRKGIEKLVEAVNILNNSMEKEFVVLAITERPKGMKILPGNFIFYKDYNEVTHEQIMAFYQSIDFLVAPTQCEGFGMPILEAMISKTPVVHAWFEPLSEFSTQEWNIVFPYAEVEEVESRGGLFFKIHKYFPEDLAEAMKYAIEVFRKEKETYEEMREKVFERAKEFDIDKTYQYFVDKLK